MVETCRNKTLRETPDIFDEQQGHQAPSSSAPNLHKYFNEADNKTNKESTHQTNGKNRHQSFRSNHLTIEPSASS